MKRKTLALVVLSLIIGGLIGFITAGQITKYRIDRLRKIAAHEGPQEARRLARILDLSEAQRDSIRPIIQAHRPEQRKLFRQQRLRMDSLRDQMFSEIRPHLNKAQKEKLEHMRTHRPMHANERKHHAHRSDRRRSE